MKRFLSALLICAFAAGIIIGLPLMSVSGSPASTVKGNTRAEIAEMIKRYPHSGFGFDFETMMDIDSGVQTIFSENPSVINPYIAGSIKSNYLTDTLNALKMVRFLAGVPYADISFSDGLNRSAQHKAVVLAALGVLDHNAPQPKDMSDAFYQASQSAAESLHYSSYASHNLAESILGFVADTGANNMAQAGHRKMMLSPNTKYFGVGYAGTEGNISAILKGGFTAVHADSISFAAGADSCVAWPNAGDFPLQYFLSSGDTDFVVPIQPWSLFLSSSYQNITGDYVSVILTRARDGKMWVFDKNTRCLDDSASYLDYSLNHFSAGGRTITFRPNIYELGYLSDGDSFDVLVQGLKHSDGSDGTIQYTINFFDLSKEPGGNQTDNQIPSGNTPETTKIPETTEKPEATEKPDDRQYAQLPFNDVPRSEWYYDTIESVYNLGLMVGMTETEFEPNGRITLAQAITMAARAHGCSDIAGTVGVNWYDTYVDYAIRNGIIRSYDFSNYGGVYATRAQMAYIFANVIPESSRIKTSNLTPPDVSKGDKYGQDIYLLYSLGVLTGNDSIGTFAPDSYITRAEAAAVVLRIYTLMSGGNSQNTQPDSIAYGSAIIRFDANGGVGAPVSQIERKDSEGVVIYKLPVEEPVKSGSTFLGWRVSGNSSDTIFSPGEMIYLEFGNPENDTTVTFYAQWKEDKPFVPVTSITGIQPYYTENNGYITFSLASATANPGNATNRFIEWRIVEEFDGGEGKSAVVNGSTVTVKSNRSILLEARVKDGISAGVDYVEYFSNSQHEDYLEIYTCGVNFRSLYDR